MIKHYIGGHSCKMVRQTPKEKMGVTNCDGCFFHSADGLCPVVPDCNASDDFIFKSITDDRLKKI